MIRKVPYYEIVTFADTAFHGNPAAVCVLDEWLNDTTMLAIAAENAATATAFVVPGPERSQLRWFTEVVEEDMCGHGTIGAAWVVLNELCPTAKQARFETRSGILGVVREGADYVLDLPARPPRSMPRYPDAEVAIGRPVEQFLASSYHIAVMKSARDVAELTPALDCVAKLQLPGLIVTAPGDGFGCDIVSRYFSPSRGIPEDPATGSVHAQIVPYWAQRLGKNSLTSRQLSRRGGAMTCRLLADRVAITTQASLYLKGEIHLMV